MAQSYALSNDHQKAAGRAGRCSRLPARLP
jgi:hypothetical protein